jgi:hypothetical protein
MTDLSSKNDLTPGKLNINIHEERNKILGLEKSETAQQIKNLRDEFSMEAQTGSYNQGGYRLFSFF